MKPEPLKNKQCETRAGNPIHMTEDIASAVQWLKQEINNCPWIEGYKNIKLFHSEHIERINKIINKAFPDICNDISLCKSCSCMTKTINGNCGKCKEKK